MVVVKSNHGHQTTMIDRTLNMVPARWYIQLSFELLFCASSKKYFTQSSPVCITLVNHNFKFSTSLSRVVENEPMSSKSLKVFLHLTVNIRLRILQMTQYVGYLLNDPQYSTLHLLLHQHADSVKQFEFLEPARFQFPHHILSLSGHDLPV